jgi:DNA-binding winged helix-turn-helix (wHTH) protein
MKAQPESCRRTLRFGVFELDSSTGELRKHGHVISLQEQPLKVLLCLLENEGAVVSRHELTQKIWSDGTFIDYEHGLNAAVARLRQALRDSAENPRYIETVARKGYRFIAPVTEIPVLEPASLQSSVRETSRALRWPKLLERYPRLWLAGGAISIFTLGLVLYLFVGTPQHSGSYAAVPLTTYLGSELCPSFAPDGTKRVPVRIRAINPFIVCKSLVL